MRHAPAAFAALAFALTALSAGAAPICTAHKKACGTACIAPSKTCPATPPAKRCRDITTKQPAKCGSPHSQPVPMVGPYIGLKYVGSV
jgi:hypothetical protein